MAWNITYRYNVAVNYIMHRAVALIMKSTLKTGLKEGLEYTQIQRHQLGVVLPLRPCDNMQWLEFGQFIQDIFRDMAGRLPLRAVSDLIGTKLLVVIQRLRPLRVATLIRIAQNWSTRRMVLQEVWVGVFVPDAWRSVYLRVAPVFSHCWHRHWVEVAQIDVGNVLWSWKLWLS